MTADQPGVNAARERILKAFRSGRGATDGLAAEASEALRLSWTRDQTLGDVARDELLLELLHSFSLFPVWLERAMTRRRLGLLFSEPREDLAPLAAALAIQCHLNEYAWNEDPAETERVERLAANLETLTQHQVMVLACYRPLARLPGADALLARGKSVV